MQNHLAAHFGSVAEPTDLSRAALHHFNRQLRFLADPEVIARTWSAIAYRLRRSGVAIEGKSVLDVGCGTGYVSIYFAAAGASEVVGIDPRESKIEAGRRYLSHLPPDLARRVRIERAGIADAGYRDAFDIVFATEAISHINDEALFQRLHAMVRPGGVLFVSDNNNALNRGVREENLELWERTENGPAGPTGHHTVETPYRELRREWIAREFGRLGPDEVDLLASNTAYMFGDELRAACERYVRDGVLPGSMYRRGTPPVHPTHGYLMEQMFNPFELKRELLSIGFRRCTLYGAHGLSRSWAVRQLVRLLPLRLNFALQQGFALVAQK